MPRRSANSTAIAALVSLGLVTPSLAEVTLPAAEAATQGAARAQSMPLLGQLLDRERQAGLGEGALSCLDGLARPCADDMPLMTPAGVAVQLSEDGAMILAPAKLQPYSIGADGQPRVKSGFGGLAEARLPEFSKAALALGGTPAPEAQPEGEAANDAAPPAEEETEQPNVFAKGNEDAPEAAPQPQAEAEPERQPKPERQAQPEPQAEAEAEAEPEQPANAFAKPAPDADELAKQLATAQAETQAEPKPEAQPKPEPQAEAAPPAEAEQDELAKQLAAAQSEAEPEAAPEAQPEAATKDSFAAQEPRLTAAEAEAAGEERATSMALLNNVLAREIRAGLTADGLLCIDGSDRPCAEGVALVSPGGVTAEVAEDGRIVIGPMNRQQYIVDEEGKLRARGSNTAAAREAASAAAPTAEAFNKDSAGEVVNETVAEARSSAQDFETSLTDAIRNATQSADQKDDDRGGDLAKAAIAGLGALAVGQMLSGNREVTLNAGDRVVVTRADGSQQVLKDDNALLRQAGNQVQTENYSDGSSRSVVTRPDGSQVITIRASDLTVLRRIHVAADGTETVLIDESVEVPAVDVSALPAPVPPAAKPAAPDSEAALREALAREAAVNRRFTLSQIRTIPEVRNLVAPVDISAITFDTGSAAINPDQARQLATLGNVIQDAVRANPREIFLIEGHTDAVGSAVYNLALSDRRAESVALALAEYFEVPPENLVVQGYGEEYLKIPTLGDERQNRRASVRRITDLLASTQ